MALEIDEYVATDHIQESLEDVLDTYSESVRNPTERTNVWVSGFFGSGKSSFAKILGYLLENRTVLGQAAADRFCAQCDSAKIRALLNVIHAQAPTMTVFLDLSTGTNVAAEGESMVLPLYRALLERLDYSRNVLLAELEFVLEGDGALADFEAKFEQATDGKAWRDRRNIGLAKNEASHALHLLRPDTYPQPDSFARSESAVEVNHNWFTARAKELLARRGEGANRVVFVVDEVGQYVARSTERMLDLNGLAEAVQKHKGPLWLVATSQERLTDVVDSLEGKQVELARVKDRFPLRVDLLPTDIDEVTGRRVLSKTDEGRQAVAGALKPYRNKLAANLRLVSPTRDSTFDDEEFLRLYPLVPYQIQLLVDAVSARRAQGRGSPMLGGATRTIVKVAQQLIIRPEVGIGDEAVGRLATMDRAYELLRDVVPTAWQGEVTQVAQKYGADSLECRVMKTVALCLDVPALTLSTQNLAALLHPSVSDEGLRDEVAAALDALVADDRLRRAEDGYRLQSPEQKSWEKERRGIDPKPADAMRVTKSSLKTALVGLTATRGRSFRVALSVEGEKLTEGDVTLAIEEADGGRLGEIRTASRETAAADTVYWTYPQSPDTYEAATEVFRSATMIERHNTPHKTPGEVELLGEERSRQARSERLFLDRLQRDLSLGTIVFRGFAADAPEGDVKSAAQRAVGERLGDIYERLSEFAASISTKDVLAVLRADKLDGLPDSLKDDGIGLVKLTPKGYTIATDSGPLEAVIAVVRERSNYGQEATGSFLERKFGDPPYGGSVEAIEAVLAAGMRAGLLEVIHQSSRIASASDQRLDKVFGTLPAFRSSVFRPPAPGPERTTRADLAKKVGRLTGSNPSIAAEQLAAAVRSAFEAKSETCTRVVAGLQGAGLTVPGEVGRAAAIIQRIRDDDDDETITTASQAWDELVGGCARADALAHLLDEDMPVLHQARLLIATGSIGLPAESAQQLSELNGLLSADDLVASMTSIRALCRILAEARRAAMRRPRLDSERTLGVLWLHCMNDSPTRNSWPSTKPSDLFRLFVRETTSKP